LAKKNAYYSASRSRPPPPSLWVQARGVQGTLTKFPHYDSLAQGTLMAKRETNAQRTEFEDERKRLMEQCAVLTAKDFSDSEDPNPKPIAALEGRASRGIEELARQIHCCCSDKKWTNYQKRVACEQLVKLAFLSTASMYRLAKEFPEVFREIAEELPHFPCLFPGARR
jgi:hypothetical protein